MSHKEKEAELRGRILQLVSEYSSIVHAPREFIPGRTPIPASSKVIGEAELSNLVEASLDGWLTTGRFNDAFERRLAKFLGVKHVLTTNSGSSANLLALSALTSPQLADRALKSGDEVITVAAGFPTTVNPILLYGLVPVFVDVDIPTYNVNPAELEAAISGKTRAIMLAHTLGNPFNLDVVTQIASKHDLWLIEDCCDALGSTFFPSAGNVALESPASSRDSISGSNTSSTVRHQLVGTFGHIGTVSFYPAHHITMGEGGAVFTQDDNLKRIMESIRDWGRDCYCAPGKENTCGKRFAWQLGTLPFGYDHKYTYSHLGFNLKISDMQAACALAQLERLPKFIEARRRNFAFLRERLKSLSDVVILPEATPRSDPSWFGFPITLRNEAPVSRPDIQKYLDQYGIGSRLLFGGNLVRQPYMHGREFRVSGTLRNTDKIMNDSFWIGLHPGLGEPQLEFVGEKLEQFLSGAF